MFFSPKRLRALLEPAGFTSAYCSRGSMIYNFRRPSSHLELEEFIRVHGRGKYGTSASVRVVVSLEFRIPALKRLGEPSLLMELATDKSRGIAVFESRDEAKEWEDRVALLAPGRAAELATERGPALLARTEVIRGAVARYLSLIPNDMLGCSGWLYRLEPTLRAEVERIADWPAVCHEQGTEWACGLAAWALITFGAEVEGSPSPFWGKDPLRNEGMLDRLALLIDRLLERASWPFCERPV